MQTNFSQFEGGTAYCLTIYSKSIYFKSVNVFYFRLIYST